GPVAGEFFDRIKRNHQPPFLTECDQDPDKVLLELALRLLEEQKEANNVRWAKNVRKNFDLINKIIEEVEKYKKRKSLPLTWKDHTHITRYLN
ncbi:5326_t:CDS:2, partial [Gigaspora rosea]